MLGEIMEIKVEITYKRIKNLHLRVKDGIVKVSSPMMVSKQRIMKFVNDNLDFINNQKKLPTFTTLTHIIYENYNLHFCIYFPFVI